MKRSSILSNATLTGAIIDGFFTLEVPGAYDQPAGTLRCPPAIQPATMDGEQFRSLTFTFEGQLFWDEGDFTLPDDSKTITRTQVAEDDRLDFLPKHMGLRLLFRGQNRFMEYMDRLSPQDYGGGYWEFYELSNGGWYTAPAGEQRYRMEWDGNYYKGEMSADAAGITASLFTICELANVSGEDKLIAAYHLLLDYARQHAEAQEILSAID